VTALHVAGVTKYFGPVEAVAGVDLTVSDASITAVLGPSGCGKTTLLRLIAGFLRPDGGRIAFGGVEVAGPDSFTAPQRRRVGYVPQEGALFPHLDVAANIAFGLPRAQRRSATGRARVEEVLDLVELPATYAARRPHELSGGQQQRVALARALAPQPSVVLLDEPFSSLDASLRAATGRAVIRAVHAAGATAVLVTHDQDEALSLADQVAVMRAGRVVQAGSPDEVYRHPVDAEVATFVGGAAVVEAQVRDGVASTYFGDLMLVRALPDGPAQVLVRPEQIRLGEPAAPGAPPVEAEVTEVRYYGHDAAVALHLSDGRSLVARVSGHAVPALGDHVTVSVQGPVVAVP
jgi:iron(III) transport system ATP-binding protein